MSSRRTPLSSSLTGTLCKGSVLCPGVLLSLDEPAELFFAHLLRLAPALVSYDWVGDSVYLFR